jgi:hypothetical protein
MSRNRYFLNPGSSDGWDLKQEGVQRAHRHFRTKEEALKYSRQFVREQGNSQLVIKRKDGAIQTEHTYDNDPRRYPG